MVKKEEVAAEEAVVAEVEVAAEEAPEEEAPKEKKAKPKKPNKLQIAEGELEALKGRHAEVHALLDAQYGGDPTVRTFMQLADNIKALLPL